MGGFGRDGMSPIMESNKVARIVKRPNGSLRNEGYDLGNIEIIEHLSEKIDKVLALMKNASRKGFKV
ncbi:hypothetical protein GOBAR_DD06003 [Gossypium barbadense]|nr:hypothetical protein GOBAR_DD06003 [Gossypium barbadense]